jgi:AP-3 complex subunit delta-1
MGKHLYWNFFSNFSYYAIMQDLSNAMSSTLPMVLNGFSHLTTPDLSRDLASDVFALLTHSRPTVRKSAVVSLFKLLLTYPDALSVGVERLKERLGDDDPGKQGL